MLKLNYYEFLKNCKEPYSIRLQIVRYALKFGIKPAAREFSTTVKTVKKWLNRYKSNNMKFKDLSKRPKRSPNAIDKYWEMKIIYECQKAAKNKKRISGGLLKRKHDIPYSLNTVLRVMKDSGFKKITKKKPERKKDLREYKKKYKILEKIQIDVKYLDDIPEMYPEYIKHKLPRYEYTARCVRSGAAFIAFAEEKTLTNSMIFLILLLKHFQKNKINLNNFKIQTDNGSEFTTNILSKNESFFTTIIEKHENMIHLRIPPGAKTWQSDVETFHRLIEDELYSYESFSSKSNFLNKAYGYMKYFNYKRFNTYKNSKPVDLLKKLEPEMDINVLNFKPVILDKHFSVYQDYMQNIAV